LKIGIVISTKYLKAVVAGTRTLSLLKIKF
jgi:DNA-directed RNA polymerase subunit K/omega